MSKINWKAISSLLIPVSIGFIAVAIVLSFLKSRFGIEIGDPVDFTEDGDAGQQAEEA